MSFIKWVKNQFRNSSSKEDFHETSKDCFYENNKVENVEWWISEGLYYPSLFWARLRVFSDGKADVLFQDEDEIFGFDCVQSAKSFMYADDFSEFDSLDEEEIAFLRIPSDIVIEYPNWINKEVKFFEYIGNY